MSSGLAQSQDYSIVLSFHDGMTHVVDTDKLKWYLDICYPVLPQPLLLCVAVRLLGGGST